MGCWGWISYVSGCFCKRKPKQDTKSRPTITTLSGPTLTNSTLNSPSRQQFITKNCTIHNSIFLIVNTHHSRPMHANARPCLSRENRWLTLKYQHHALVARGYRNQRALLNFALVACENPLALSISDHVSSATPILLLEFFDLFQAVYSSPIYLFHC